MVYFGQKITLAAHQRVRKTLHRLEQNPVPGVRNLNPAYCSILVTFDALKLNHASLQEILQSHLDRLDAAELAEPRELQIPTLRR